MRTAGEDCTVEIVPFSNLCRTLARVAEKGSMARMPNGSCLKRFSVDQFHSIPSPNSLPSPTPGTSEPVPANRSLFWSLRFSPARYIQQSQGRPGLLIKAPTENLDYWIARRSADLSTEEG